MFRSDGRKLLKLQSDEVFDTDTSPSFASNSDLPKRSGKNSSTVRMPNGAKNPINTGRQLDYKPSTRHFSGLSNVFLFIRISPSSQLGNCKDWSVPHFLRSWLINIPCKYRPIAMSQKMICHVFTSY